MGWTYIHKSRHESVHDILKREFEGESSAYKGTLLKTMVVKLRTAYCAYERLNKATGERTAMALVVLLDYRPKDTFNFGYKDICESSGPCATDCPAAILDLLTEPISETSRDWRASCRSNLEKRKGRIRLTKGLCFRTATPVKFRNGEEIQNFRVAGRGQYYKLTGAHNGIPCVSPYITYKFSPHNFGPITKIDLEKLEEETRKEAEQCTN